MSTTETASPVVAPVRPAFGRRVVDFTVEKVAPVVVPVAPAAPAPLRLNAREKEIAAAKAANDAEIAKAQAAAKAKNAQSAANERAANVPARCSHDGCRTTAISRMMSWDRSGKPVCGKHAGPGSVSWQALQRRNEQEAERWLNERLRR